MRMPPHRHHLSAAKLEWAIRLLGHKAQLSCAFSCSPRRQRSIAERHFALIGRPRTQQHAQESALASSIAASEQYQLARSHLHIHAVQQATLSVLHYQILGCQGHASSSPRRWRRSNTKK
jgi:hypothetical protein